MLLSRRDLLNRLAFGVAFLPALATAPRSLWKSLLFEPEGQLVLPKPLPINPFTRDGKALVALVHGQEPHEMLEAGLGLLGGIHRLVIRGKKVLLKPNIVNDRPPPTTTSASAIASVVRQVRAQGAAEITVADSSGMIRFPTSENLIATGVRAAAEAEGARVLALEDEPWVQVEPPGAESLPRFYISKPVYEADVFINLPVVKTHRFAHYSCGLKNLVGITHPRYRPSATFLAGNWHERIAELNLAVHPQLTIADATHVMIEGGPTSGTSARADLLLLSGDRVALDVVAVALIRTFGAWPKVEGPSPWEQRQIKRAIELGLGVKGPEQIELVTQSIVGRKGEFEHLVDRIRQDIAVKG
jgi:uncharacterized protein (DUF362 family)